MNSGRRRAWALLAAVPLFGVAAAFGIAPDTETRPLELRTVIESIQIPVAQALDDGTFFVREERVARGDTVSAVLSRLDIRDPGAIEFIRNDRGMRPLHQLAPGRAVRAKTDSDGDLHWLEYTTGQGTVLRLERGEGSRFTASEQALELERRIEMKSGEIRSSLFAATDAANLPDAIATQMAEMFSSDIDFHRDLRRGDTFTVVYEAFYHHGERVRVGRVVAAEFLNGRRVFQGVWFESEPGQGGYYTPGGLSLRRAFLRSPLEFSRISSGFSNARYHPILQEMRAHRGIDYAAPIGTPIKAVANGTVDFVGRQGGYGNLVVLAHANNVTTVYGHMNSFAPSVRKGARVNQGDVIGTVGMTGLATGPHLHFEFRISGVHMDPLKVALPEALPITNALRPAFELTTGQYSEKLRILRGSNLARLE
ncbi:MAG: peptidoglycan DD-metalloendopeptidase family protein [bacterium]|nr:peptidoglycan DD-metalloendopeptidase family protein [Betaproteobacteria bacterium]